MQPQEMTERAGIIRLLEWYRGFYRSSRMSACRNARPTYSAFGHHLEEIIAKVRADHKGGLRWTRRTENR
jgi:hypothetical protein